VLVLRRAGVARAWSLMRAWIRMPASLGLVIAIIAAASSAAAHPLAPALLELTAHDGGGFEVLWRLPQLRALGVTPSVRLPAPCHQEDLAREAVTARGIERRWRVACDMGDLIAADIEFAGLIAPASVVVRVIAADGTTVDGLVTAERPRFRVHLAPSPLAVVRAYVRLGLEHIVTGPDHLLFIFGLVLLASTWRRVLVTVTAFTAGHSLTLALAALGLVSLPSGPIELAIAASVLVVAIEAARAIESTTREVGHPWTLAAGFGLLHGLGFASALNDLGLAAGALVVALVSFNVGIELGQIAFVAVVLSLSVLARRVFTGLPIWASRVPVYGMGTLAAYWCFERAASWLGVGS